MENFINLYLLDLKKQIETNHKTSDNKAYHIRSEKLATINGLITSKRIVETDRKEALKIIGVKA
jgi:uncharacterized protein with gpF-like domain